MSRILTMRGDYMNLKTLRESRSMTQGQLAKELDVSRTTVSMWETGASLPRGATLIKLSQIFNCTLDELLDKDAKLVEEKIDNALSCPEVADLSEITEAVKTLKYLSVMRK